MGISSHIHNTTCCTNIYLIIKWLTLYKDVYVFNVFDERGILHIFTTQYLPNHKVIKWVFEKQIMRWYCWNLMMLTFGFFSTTPWQMFWNGENLFCSQLHGFVSLALNSHLDRAFLWCQSCTYLLVKIVIVTPGCQMDSFAACTCTGTPKCKFVPLWECCCPP